MENEKSSGFTNPRHSSASSTASSMHKLVLNHDVFRYGVIRAHSKLNESNLRRIIVYALKKKELHKSKLGSGYTSNSTISRTSSTDRDSTNFFGSSTSQGFTTIKNTTTLNNNAPNFQQHPTMPLNRQESNTSNTPTTPNPSEHNKSSPLWPNISWQSWRYVATEKVAISETLAWAYWDTFCAVCAGHDSDDSTAENLKLSELRNNYLHLEDLESQTDTIRSYDFDQPISSNLPKGDHWERYRETGFLPSTTKFVLFLFIQQLAQDNKKSLRRSLSGENWPDSGASDTECDKNKNEASLNGNKNGKKVRRDSISLPGSTNINDEMSVVNFIKDNLTSIMNIFNPLSVSKNKPQQTETIDSKNFKPSKSSKTIETSENRYLSSEFTGALNLLLNLFNHEVSKNKFTKVGLERIFGRGATSEKQFKSYVQANLDKSPFGMTGTVDNGVEIPSWISESLGDKSQQGSWLLSDSDEKNTKTGTRNIDPKNEDSKNNKPAGVIKTNSALTNTHKKLFITGLQNSAIMRNVCNSQNQDSNIKLNSNANTNNPHDNHPNINNLISSEYDVLIYRCIKSTIFLTGSFKSISIEKCYDCTIVIGCVYSAARIITSRGCKVTVASRFLSLTNSSDCAVNVLTSGHPLVLSGCRRIVLGPYNTSYAEIENNINNCGLKEAKNGDMFSKPLNLQDQSVMAVNTEKTGHSRRSQSSPTPAVPLNVVSLQKTYDYSPIAIPLKITPESSKNTMKLCDSAPLEYRLAWEKRLQNSSNIKQRIKKKMLQKKKELEREAKLKDAGREQSDARKSSTDTIDDPEISNQPNLLEQLQSYFHEWLDNEGHRDEIDRIHSLSQLNDRQQI